MDLELKDKHIFIAGSSRGIGLSIAESFLKEGANVSLTARTPEQLEKSYDYLGGKFGKARLFRKAGDMTKTAPIAEALAEAEAVHGPLFCVVGNVGSSDDIRGWEVDDERFDEGLKQNFLGSYRLAREAVRLVKPRPLEQRAGFNIIFISSTGGVEAMTTPLTYGSPKAMLNHATKELSKSLGPDQIRVNTVAPGMVLFPGGTWERRLESHRDYWLKYAKTQVALQRWGKPEEIGDLCAFLASPRASLITGAIVIADAGQVK